VKAGLQQGKDLAELPLEVLRGFHPSISEDVYGMALTLQASLNARKVLGGTAPERVREQIAAHRERLS
jgi:argininosuccinate lyase